ncbi:hypothetical protein AA313_de0206933 [Arthrobotrys entomopaga]|nr:hypothetical protein AA313_de0206933 [Arthrobotrys entomopaga]
MELGARIKPLSDVDISRMRSTATITCFDGAVKELIMNITIWSRHKLYRSTHTVRYHYGSRLACDIVENQMFMLPRPGTKIIVERLFGNYPVRMIAREKMTPAEVSREWRDIKRKVVEALFFVDRPVKVVVRDESRAVKIAFRGTAQAETWQECYKKLLEEAGHAEIPWESTAARWGGFEVDGIFGMRPVTDKGAQFIFVNGRPISNTSTSALYSTINRQFASSSFATTAEKGVTGHGVGKGVEKYPSFVILMVTDDERVRNAEGLGLYEENGIVADISKLLEIMVDEFLKVRGWRKRTMKRTAEGDGVDSSRPTKKFVWRNRADIAANPEPEMFSRGKSSATFTTSRSGAVLAGASTAASNGPGAQNLTAIAPTRLTLLPQDRRASLVTSTEWAKNFLSTFQNPVFKRPEAKIPELTLLGKTTHDHNQKLAKISKEALRRAEVMGQIDNKYILLVLNSPTLVVMVDQHAADERVRLERLWQTYDCSPKPLPKPVGYFVRAEERQILELYRHEIREWGFEFKLATILSVDTGLYTVRIFAVQELVADRYLSDPLLAIRLFQTWTADFQENGTLEGFPKSGDWTKRMVKAPKVLVEVFNSRACRSACMFNDKLRLAQCQSLIGQLAACDFPFQCAHGRPSMAPLVDIMPGSVQQCFEIDKPWSFAPRFIGSGYDGA